MSDILMYIFIGGISFVVGCFVILLISASGSSNKYMDGYREGVIDTKKKYNIEEEEREN